MFDFKDHGIDKVLNPLQITKNSMIEFNVGKLDETGLYRFKKIIEMNIEDKSFARYLIYSKSEQSEYVFEAFPSENGQLETYLFSLKDTVPFSEDFLEIAGQKYLTTPDGTEYERTVLPQEDDRIDGISGRIKVYDIETDQVEREIGIKVWDYKRDVDGIEEYLNVEMMEDTGMFRIFTGELLEDIFYKVYHATK